MSHAHDRAHDHALHAHDHRDDHRTDHRGMAASERDAHSRRLLVVMGFGLVVLVAEVIAGFLANSLVLLSDAAHMSTDIAALALAYAAVRISQWAPTAQKSYGWYRAETVAAFVNALALWVIAFFFIVEAYRRLRDPPAVDGSLVALVGGLSLVANIIMAVVLHRGRDSTINMRGAYLHVLSDAVGSLAALAAGLGMLYYGATWLDPAATLLVAGLLVVWTWRLTRESLHILLEGTPASVDAEKLRARIAGTPGVIDVHDLHLWSLTTGVDNLSAHIMVEDAAQGPAIVAAIRADLVKRHKLSHVTIEVETKDSPNCIRCD